MIFLVVLWGKMIFLFPPNMILFLRRKIKDDLFFKKKKKNGNMIFYSNAPKSDLSTHKKIVLEYDLSCIIWKDCFFLENMIFFLWTENER